MDKATNKSYIFSFCLSLAVTTFIVFEPAIHNGFISFDDNEYIFDNNYITSGLTLKNIIWAFTNVHANNYHPLTSLSHMLDCELYGTNPAGHHFTNLLFHISNTLLLFLVLGRMTKSLWASAFVAALFALHPLHVESVAWASERKDVLSTFFWMLTLLAYTRYVERPAKGCYLLTLLIFAMGLLSKSMLVTLPFVLLLLDYWPLNRFGNTHFGGNPRLVILGRLVLEKIPFFALSAIFSIVTFSVQLKIGLMKSFIHYPSLWRIENALVSYIIYIEKMFWPVNLAIFYPYPRGNIPLWQIIGAVLVLVFITSIAFWKLRQHPYIAVGWLWFLGTLIPVIGIFQVGLQARADRYTYIPYTGLFIIVAWGISDLLARLRYRKVIFSLSAAILLSALGIKTYIQTIYWHDNILLYTHAAEAVKNNWWAHHLLGKTFVSQNRLEEAIIQFKEALRIDPQNATVQNELAKAFLDNGDVNQAAKLYQEFLPPLPDDLNEPKSIDALFAKRHDLEVIIELYINANINLATALARQGNIDEAARRFKEVLRITPDSIMAHRNLGDIFLQKGQIDEAIKQYTAAIQIKPNLVIEYKNLAKSLCWDGKLEDSVRIYQMIVQLLPNDSEAYTGLGIVLAQQGKLDEAVSCFTKVVSIEPNFAGGYINLGNALNLQSKSSEAIDCYTKAVQLEPDFVLAHYCLGQILMQKGEIDEAIAHFNQAIRIDPNYTAARESLNLILAEKQKLQGTKK